MKLREAYGELEVELGATRDDVQTARRILLRVWHPDRHQHDPKLRAAAEKKTVRLNAAFEVIEAAAFPGPELFSDKGDAQETQQKATVEEQIRLREIELREREVAVQEKLAEKPTTTEWIDLKASLVKQGVTGLAVIVTYAVAAIVNLLVLFWVLQRDRFMEPEPLWLAVVVATASSAGLAFRANRLDIARAIGIVGLTTSSAAMLTAGLLSDATRVRSPNVLPLLVLGVGVLAAVAQIVRFHRGRS